ncbi:phenylacetate--CoA ligase PaaK [Phytomonospora endophytica]|uniref:Phenylacetate-coenzyme A ligase n=1 Tax=Phytomonospora endophytica TaxID=714109 RepID=A0A841FJU9_9ACTN|nr:phenylacetate--CoA ligase PaaK [Phytomonospora endophytica]MBB6036154.1 phenylacetate-CoA ligase [Phytomonospora endophytica]GIG67057.1 phenylacetate-coenzyme A ligase [Phytomonospora endophytica]
MPSYQPPPAALDPIETASADELRALQDARLRETIRHAHDHSPHYRAAFAAAGVEPGDVGGIGELSRLPFTTKEDLRRNYPFGMFAVPRERVARIHASSGTTGRPTVVGYTAGDLRTWAEVMARSLRAAGARPGQILHNAYGYGLFTGGLGVHAGAEHLGCTVVPVSGGLTERQVRLIADFGPEIITVTPTYMLAIADEMERQGIDPAATSLKVGVFGAEPWTGRLRETLEERLDIHAVDIYGLSEVIGPGVAQECLETKDGLHVWEDHFYPEVVDPGTGALLPDGELGELVFTSLTKRAMPVIRYRTGDLTRLLPGTARTMRRMEKITGRTDDMLIVRGVNVFPTQIEELLLAEAELSPHFQCVLGKRGPLDTLTVTAEPATDSTVDAAEEAGRRLAERIKGTIGVTAAVRIVAVGGVERSAGKMRRVVDER